jgi:hypothetical protein
MDKLGSAQSWGQTVLSRLTFGIAILARSAFLLLTVAFSATAFAAVKNDVRLIDAAKNGDAAAVRTYLKGKPNVNVRYPDGTTALHWAAHRVDADLVKLLIKAGADVNTADDLGTTPLELASQTGNAAVIQALLAAGAAECSSQWRCNAAHACGARRQYRGREGPSRAWGEYRSEGNQGPDGPDVGRRREAF